MSAPGRVVHAIVALPPPVEGASVVNEAVVTALRVRGADVRVVDLAVPKDLPAWRFHSRRIFVHLRAARTLLRTSRGDAVYGSLPGGLSLLYWLPIAAVLRWRRCSAFLHHHNFSYLHERSPLMALLLSVLPRSRSLHILLSAGMAERYREVYGSGLRTTVLSNAWLVEDPDAEPTRLVDGADAFANDQRPLVLLHLSNLTADKGLAEVLTTAERLAGRDRPVADRARATLALGGPVAARDRPLLLDALERLGPAATWAGPVYGPDKAAMFRAADVFLFPTRYRNEAEPLVVLEALSSGVAVVTTGRGCLPEMVGDGGLVVHAEDDFVDQATAAVRAFLTDPASLRAARAAARQRFVVLREASEAQRDSVLATMSEAPVTAH